MSDSKIDIAVDCKKIFFDGTTAELECVDQKALVVKLAKEIGLQKLLDYATDSETIADTAREKICNFIESSYDMESITEYLDDERKVAVKDNLIAELG